MLLRSGAQRIRAGTGSERANSVSQEELKPHVLPTKRTDSKKKTPKRKFAKREVPGNLEALREKGKNIAKILNEIYPDVVMSTESENPFQLLVTTILSAQVQKLGLKEIGGFR